LISSDVALWGIQFYFVFNYLFIYFKYVDLFLNMMYVVFLYINLSFVIDNFYRKTMYTIYSFNLLAVNIYVC